MLLVMIWGGIWSVGISLGLYEFTDRLGVTIHKNFIGSIFIIGPIEEFSKLLALITSYIFIKNELDEPADGLIYMSCVALGFSLIENYFYATRTADSGYLLWLRLLISTPAHVFFSAFMGLAFYTLIKQKKGFSILVISFVYASLIHGLYNGVIFHNWILIFFILVVKFSHYWTLTLLSYATSKSPYRESITKFISNNKPILKKGIECLNCGDKAEKETYQKGKIHFQKCGNCSCFVTSHNSIYHIFHHFGSDFRVLTDHYFKERYSDIIDHDKKYSTLFKGNYICEKSKNAYFFLDDLHSALDEYNLNLQKHIEEKWWYPKSLLHYSMPQLEPVPQNAITPKNLPKPILRDLAFLEKTRKSDIPEETEYNKSLQIIIFIFLIMLLIIFPFVILFWEEYFNH